MSEPVRLIKKYPNRRLYDTKTSAYITLGDVKDLVLKLRGLQGGRRQDGRRSDPQHSAADHPGRGNRRCAALLRTNCFPFFIRFYGNAMQGMLGKYLESNMKTFVDFRKAAGPDRPVFGDNTQMQADVWAQFLNFQQPAMQSMMSAYMDQSSKMFQQMQEQIQSQTRNMFHGFQPKKPKASTNEAVAAAVPKVGFVSLGCPKATVDSEHILTKLRAEGYVISPSYDDADLVIVNTCGFIDAAVAESSMPSARPSTKRQGHRHRLPGAKGDIVQKTHPRFWPSPVPTPPTRSWASCTSTCPSPTIPSPRSFPPGCAADPGPLRLPQDFRAATTAAPSASSRRCAALVSRPVGDVLAEAESLARAGVKEILVISQDTSAYGVDLQVPHRFLGRQAGDQDPLEGIVRYPWPNSAFGCASTTFIPIPRWTTSFP